MVRRRQADAEPERIKLVVHPNYQELTKEPVIESELLCRKMLRDKLNHRILRLSSNKLGKNDEENNK